MFRYKLPLYSNLKPPPTSNFSMRAEMWSDLMKVKALRNPQESEVLDKAVWLANKTGSQKWLLLDLDETLISMCGRGEGEVKV